jgi:hypothetical protein
LVLVASVTLGLLGLIVFYLLFESRHDADQRQEAFVRYANELALGIEAGRTETIDTALHHASIFAKVDKHLGGRKRVWDRRALENMQLGQHLVSHVEDGATFTLIDLQMKGKRAVALYRVLGPNGMEHLEIFLIAIGRRIHVEDLYRYSNGFHVSLAMADAMRFTESLGTRATAMMMEAQQLNRQLHNGDVAGAWEKLQTMEPGWRTSSIIRHIYLDAATWQDLDAYRACIDEIAQLADPDPRFRAYRELSFAQWADDGPAMLRALDQLAPHLGKDPWLAALRARAHLLAGDTTACFRDLDKGLVLDPMDGNLHMERFDLLARTGKHEQALAQGDTMMFLLGYPREWLADYLDSIPGIDTTQALYDWRYGEDVGGSYEDGGLW